MQHGTYSQRNLRKFENLILTVNNSNIMRKQTLAIMCDIFDRSEEYWNRKIPVLLV